MKENNLRKTYKRVIDSPTMMTWGSFVFRTLSMVIVLPFVLTHFSVAEISLWYLFAIIIGLQNLVDIGFSPTFSRVIAYAMGGAEVYELRYPRPRSARQPNWDTIGKICGTMHHIYRRLGLVWGILLLAGGSLVVMKPISLTGDHLSAWLAWGVIVVTSVFNLQGNIYNSYLQGVEAIALFRRWDIITSTGAIITSIAVLLAGGRILGLIIANQIWLLISVVVNRFLSGRVADGRFNKFARNLFHRDVFDAVWPSTWRSGVGVFMSYGLVQASGIFYAQVGDVASVASYLMGLRFIQMVSRFSQAPFYSKLPTLARLFSQDRREALLEMAGNGMRLSYWTFAVIFIWLGGLGPVVLEYIGSHANFPSTTLWNLLGVAFLIERYGAMHLQMYSLTNRILWHIANGITGLIVLAVMALLFHNLGVLAFPLGILAGYLGFYAWFSAFHSYREYKISPISFEGRTLAIPLCLIVVYVAVTSFLA